MLTSPLMMTYSNQRMLGMMVVSLIIKYSDIFQRSILKKSHSVQSKRKSTERIKFYRG